MRNLTETSSPVLNGLAWLVFPERLVSRVECIFALLCYWYTCFTSHPCPTTVRSALNHESLNTTHSPAPIRVVVEHPASAIITTNIMVFILVPSHAHSAPHSRTLRRQWTSLFHHAKGVPRATW